MKKKLLFKYSLLLLTALLIEWLLLLYSPFNIPKYIPSTPLRLDGLLLFVTILLILIFSSKEFLRQHPSASIYKLTTLGAITCLISETIFQAIRQPFLNVEGFNERLQYLLTGVIGISIFAAILSFFVAFQLKTRRTFYLVLMIIGFAVLVNLIKYFFPSLFTN
ncbi:hypothetical protein EZ428_16180 [Pedobacter frigiditerrae]|uniref:Uncharacterized protein n=1 Tax=Pedobacter frigiditerrae TaxID=2530452 RepID=A0A4R0MTH7_9SPHI|nr:hypothetical protein [Pedobacter frigiditerrae]TCC89234.1 hypothetical protein EZ428_16180 [Pedobacter frigiditerrae]